MTYYKMVLLPANNIVHPDWTTTYRRMLKQSTTLKIWDLWAPPFPDPKKASKSTPMVLTPDTLKKTTSCPYIPLCKNLNWTISFCRFWIVNGFRHKARFRFPHIEKRIHHECVQAVAHRVGAGQCLWRHVVASASCEINEQLTIEDCAQHRCNLPTGIFWSMTWVGSKKFHCNEKVSLCFSIQLM